MKFSVLIPVYNTEKYLEECLQSVLNQTYKDYEIILVDDGSTDSSSQICDDYKNKYPDIIKVIHKENQGLISARRVGIANANGDYCVFVDSDDYIMQNLLYTLNEHFIEDESIDLILYSFVYHTNGKEDKPFRQIADNGRIWNGSDKKELYQKLIFSDDVTAIWTKAVKTSLAKSDPTDYSLYHHKNMAEDRLQSLFLLTYATKIKYIYCPLYCYRYNNESISRSFTLSSIKKRDTLHVYEKALEYLPIWGMNTIDNQNRLKARSFDETMYVFCKAFELSKNWNEKKELLAFDWDAMMLSSFVDLYSEYVSQNYLELYYWYKDKKYTKLNACFLKSKLYKKYKTLKQRYKF